MRKTRANDEAVLENAVLDLFSGAGMFVRQQVPCPAGRADLVTKNAIFELKAYLNRRSLHQAIGQLTLYRPHLNPSAELVVVCIKSSVRGLHERAREAGIEVLEWPDIKRNPGVILCNPPYRS
jgi:hypothetical protein